MVMKMPVKLSYVFLLGMIVLTDRSPAPKQQGLVKYI